MRIGDIKQIIDIAALGLLCQGSEYAGWNWCSAEHYLLSRATLSIKQRDTKNTTPMIEVQGHDIKCVSKFSARFFRNSITMCLIARYWMEETWITDSESWNETPLLDLCYLGKVKEGYRKQIHFLGLYL